MNNVTQLSPVKIRNLRGHQSHPIKPNPNDSLLHRGDFLYRMGDKLNGVYVVNAGAIKLFRITETGDEHITAFLMPGDIVGLDALEDGRSRSTAVALDTTCVSHITIESMLKGNAALNSAELIQRMGSTLNRDNDLIMILSQRTAERRLAWFLIEFSDRLANRGISPSEFTLPMSRTDLAVFLGLALETVCRELARFREGGFIDINRRRFFLLDIDGLRQISNGYDDIHAKPEMDTPKHAAAGA